ncbi:helix-turn-helix domain-containing protein [Floridanema aerugineum]|jgi:HTH-type transcriptional regulator/antitoxin HigA|uniref:Type II toxin-antitoxin system HigA family antitoxin n=1 Tax=Floridaenema aerugineum BLCC-F46 TaxID=3153654 RepID=A0ABV4X2K5_9CYAN
MTLTFNPENYKQLLITYLPRVIKTEAENEKALAIVEDLMHRKRTPEEDELYQLLVTLIEKFEQEYYQPNQQNNPQSMLLFLLEESGKSLTDLQAVLGSTTAVDEIVQGQAKMTPEQARKIADFFHVNPSLFTE